MTSQDDVREVRTPPTYVAMVGMSLIWGSTFLAIRIGNEAVLPLWGASLRLLLATPLYLAIALLTGASFRSGAALRAAAVYGFLNYGVNFVLLYWGEVRVPSGTAAVLYASIPLTTGIFAALLGVHRLEAKQVVAALIGLAGVAIIFSGELSGGASFGPFAAVFLGATSAALSGVVLKLAPPQSTWVANGIGAAVGAVVCLAASFVIEDTHGLPRDLAGWGPILYLVLAGNLGAYALYGWLMTKWKVTNVHVIALVIPIIAVILGALVRAETPPAATYAGAALVLVGVALTLFTGRH